MNPQMNTNTRKLRDLGQGTWPESIAVIEQSSLDGVPVKVNLLFSRDASKPATSKAALHAVLG